MPIHYNRHGTCRWPALVRCEPASAPRIELLPGARLRGALRPDGHEASRRHPHLSDAEL